ncbi:MAG: GNAT family N-acetyltransferase [Trueperaceae bacterium]|nr:GNAT family N-acetyltransferase [Trueperaceae bacterium]
MSGPDRAGVAAAAPIALRPLDPVRHPEAAAVWDATFAAAHPLARRAWEAWWRSPDADPELAWAAERDSHLVGFALARAPRRPWAPADVGHVALLAVHPAAQRTGVGGALWDAALAALRARGRTRVRLGAEPERLLPGVPVAAPSVTWRFLRARGAVRGAFEADLLLDLRVPVPGSPLPPGVALVDDAPDEAIAFVARAFPGRWTDEVQRYADTGTAVLTWRRDGEALGFCVAARPDDPVLAGGLAWTGGLSGRVAGLGPLGLAPEARGSGLGLALVAAAARWQQDRGADAVVIDWTDLTRFYGRLGAFVWRAYQRAEVPT